MFGEKQFENPAVLFSIKEPYCSLIFEGEKTVEVRTRKPRLPVPFKGYVYQTLPVYGDQNEKDGHVVGEFVCDKIEEMVFVGTNERDRRYMYIDKDLYVHSLGIEDYGKMKLAPQDLIEYGKGRRLYGLHITEARNYEKPLPLSEFGLEYAPQGWRYVESRE